MTTHTYPGLAAEATRARNRTYEEIRQKGAVGNLNDGIEIETQGIRTRLIAWPGNGFLMGSLHVLTLAPGESSVMYEYEQAEEGLLCLKGEGEIFLHGRWVVIQAGDVAYIPEGVQHAVRNPVGSGRDFVLVTQISPPPIDLYAPSGLYVTARARLDMDLIEDLKRKAPYGDLPPENEMRYNDSHPELRVWNLTREQTRRGGALFNIFRGASSSAISVAQRLILWPGHGTRTAGLHTGLMQPGDYADVHTHPSADDCIFVWEGRNLGHLGGEAVATGPLEGTMAPAGVAHGSARPEDAPPGLPAFDVPALVGGYGAPAQTDVYLRGGYYANGRFKAMPFDILAMPA